MMLQSARGYVWAFSPLFLHSYVPCVRSSEGKRNYALPTLEIPKISQGKKNFYTISIPAPSPCTFHHIALARPIQVSSPILRDVRFRYQDDEILSRSLTSTNFHTYYQGSEMVVAGRLPPSSTGAKEKEKVAKEKEKAASGNKLIEYEIHATQAQGHEYSVAGSYNGSAVSARKCHHQLPPVVYWARKLCQYVVARMLQAS